MSRVAWGALALMSFLLVLLALVVGDPPGAALVVTGVAAVIVCRVVAGLDRTSLSVSRRVSGRRSAFDEVDFENDYRNAGSSS